MSYFAMSTSYKVIYEAKSEINVVEEGLLDSIGNAIRKIIEKIKDFFRYIRDKIKEIWKKLTKKKDEDEKSKTDEDGKTGEESKNNEKIVPLEKRTVEVEITGWFDIDNGSEVESLKKLVKEAFEQELDEARYMNNQAYKHNYHNLDMEDTPREKLNQMNEKIKSEVVKKTFLEIK